MNLYIVGNDLNKEYINEIELKLKELGHNVFIQNNPNMFNIEEKYMCLSEYEILRNNIDAILVLNNDSNDISGEVFITLYTAFKHNKTIYLMSDIKENVLESDINKLKPIIINGNLELIKKVDNYSSKLKKLVRDKIPSIIESKGQIPITRTIIGDEYILALVRKLLEECYEVAGALTKEESLEELADALECIYSIGISKGISLDEIIEMMINKREERGGFKNGIVLEKVR